MLGYTGPCEFRDVIVIVLIGVPVGCLAEAAVVAPEVLLAAELEVLLDDELPHADSAITAALTASAATSFMTNLLLR
jgi:hypothetical protein